MVIDFVNGYELKGLEQAIEMCDEIASIRKENGANYLMLSAWLRELQARRALDRVDKLEMIDNMIKELEEEKEKILNKVD